MPLKDGSISRSSKILAVEAFGNLVFFLVVVNLLMCSFFAPLTIPLHSPFLSTFLSFYDRSFGNSERIDIVSYYLPYSTLVFFRKRRGNFTLNYFDFFSHFFENNCPFGKCKLSFFSALCRGRSNIL